jgi:hypothetical protein
MPSVRSALLGLLVGVVHAGLLLGVAADLGYGVEPSAYTLLGALWRYSGLVLVAALPVWLAVQYRLVTPLVALVLTTGYVLGIEIPPPGPTFRDLAELEGLAESTGITVVENGLYIVRYMVHASVWALGFLLTGLVEYTVRSSRKRLPAPRLIPALPLPAPRRQAIRTAAAGGLLHGAVMIWLAHQLGVTLSGASDSVLFLFGAVGMVLLAAVPLYLLARRQLIAPVTLLTLFVIFDARATLTASVEDPHALYFGGWFFFFGVILAAAGIEHGLRLTGLFRTARSRL